MAAVLRGGTIVTLRESLAESSRTPGGRLLTQQVEYDVIGAEGRLSGNLGFFSGREIYTSQTAGQAFMMPIPFSRGVSAVRWGDLAVVAPSHRYEFAAYDVNGTLRRIVRLDHALIHSTPAHLDAHFLELLRQRGIRPTTGADREEALRESRQAFGDLPLPETLPAFASLMTDALNHLWVREFVTPTEAPPAPLWAVFDPDGRVLGYVETPDGLEIHEIGADYILGRTTDDLGVEYVQIWPLSR